MVHAGAIVLKKTYRVADGSRLVNVNVFDEDITIPFKVDPSLLLYDHPIVANYLGRCIRATNQKQVNKYLEMEVTDFRYKFFIILKHYITYQMHKLIKTSHTKLLKTD